MLEYGIALQEAMHEYGFDEYDYRNSDFYMSDKSHSKPLEESLNESIDIDISSIKPGQKDFDRAEGLAFKGSRFNGDGSPFGSEASRMAKLIKDPVKLVKRAKAVVSVWGADEGQWSNTGYYHREKPNKDTDVWGPFKTRLEEFGFSVEQIDEIKNFKNVNESLIESASCPDAMWRDFCDFLDKWADYIGDVSNLQQMYVDYIEQLDESLNESVTNAVYVMDKETSRLISKNRDPLDPDTFFTEPNDTSEAQLFGKYDWMDEVEELLPDYTSGYDISDFEPVQHFGGSIYEGIASQEESLKESVPNKKVVIKKQRDNYNVQILNFINGKWYYSGNGRFCDTLEEAEKWKEKFEKDIEANFSDASLKKPSKKLNEEVWVKPSNWRRWKVGDSVKYTYVDFDGQGVDDCEVISVEDDHAIISPIDPNMSDIRYWIDDDIIS